MECRQRWGRHRSGLLGVLDVLGHAVRVFDLEGRPVHQTPALRALLESDPEADVLRGEMAAAANALCTIVRGSRPASAGPPGYPMTVSVRTALAGYTLRASLHGGPHAGPESVILIALERCTPVPRDEGELRELHGLTRAEVRVARLIAQGRANAEIARELRISPHTARRHTEQILRKLRVRSRTEVAARLLR